MQKVLDRLFQAAPAFPTKLKNVARVILDNPTLVATTSMRALAKKADVTPPTMIRLATTLGFDNYDSFRQVFKSSVNGRDFEERANALQSTSITEGLPAIIRDISEAGVGNINQYYQELDLDKLRHAADIILAAPNVYVVSAGGLHWISSYFHYVCKMAVPQMRLPRTNGNGLVEGLIPIKPGDVIIGMAYQPYAKHSIEAFEFALSRGARMIYLSDSKAAPLASQAEVLLLQNTASPQFFPSMLSVMAAVETLIAVIVAQSGVDAIRSIAEYSEIRRKSDFYLS